MNSLFDYVYIENVFSKEFCGESINHINKLKWDFHTWYANSNVSTTKDFMTAHSEELQEKMKSKIYDFLLNYIKNIKQSFALNQFSEIRFNIYESGCGIKEHIDHIHSLFDGERKGIPILSMVGLFNDDYTGGDFILCNKKITLKTGDIIVFPSVFLYPHSVKPVISGTRYSWVVWVY